MRRKLKSLEQVLNENPYDDQSDYMFVEDGMPAVVISMREKFGNYVNIEEDQGCYRDINDLWLYHPKWFEDE